MPARRALPFACSLALVLWASIASPAPRRGARLAWARGDGADTCVGVAGLTEDVKARLGWDPFALPLEVEIEGTAQRTARGYRADLAFRAKDGTSLGKRALESRTKDCRSLGDAVAVAITVTIDPDASGVAPAPGESPDPEPWTSLTSSPVDAPPAPPPRAPREDEPRVRVTAGGGGAVGLVPGVGASASLRAGFMIGDRLEVGLGATYVPQSREGAFGFGLAAGEARGCVLPWRAGGLLRLCGAALAGAFEVFAHSSALTPVDVGLFPWLGAEAGPVLSVPLRGPFRIELGASAIVPLLRRQGFLRGAPEPVWGQSAVAARAELGAAALF
ncbi:MAG: hypothetical protein KF850_38520 [Labilithrix sp.]|nr:hypothetical protein [Labilithrix sp.]